MKLLNRFLPLFLTFVAVTNCMAQDDYAKEKDLITKIKRSPSTYVFAEATCKTVEEAQAVAEEMFYQNVNEYVASSKKLQEASNIVVNDPQALKNEIAMPRGSNMHRIFIYAKKSDIVALNNPVFVPTQPSEPTPPGNTASNESSMENGTLPAKDASIPASKVEHIFPDAALELALLENINQLNASLKQMKQSGEITAYDKYNNLPVKSEWYLVLYDATGALKAVLTDGDVRLNVATGKEDDVKNYPKHAAVGIKFRK